MPMHIFFINIKNSFKLYLPKKIKKSVTKFKINNLQQLKA